MPRKKTAKPAKPKAISPQVIPVYAAEKISLDDMVRIKCKADVKPGQWVFIQDNIESKHTGRFAINSGFKVIEDPDNIIILLENLLGYDRFYFNEGHHIADIVTI